MNIKNHSFSHRWFCQSTGSVKLDPLFAHGNLLTQFGSFTLTCHQEAFGEQKAKQLRHRMGTSRSDKLPSLTVKKNFGENLRW